MFEEGGEELGVGDHVLAAHRLPDGVHREGGDPQVHRPDPHLAGHDRADGRAAGTVVSHNKFLTTLYVVVFVSGFQFQYTLPVLGLPLA